MTDLENQAPQPARMPTREEIEAMEAVMESVDPATWPGLSMQHRAALGRFAKPFTPSAGVDPMGERALSEAERVDELARWLHDEVEWPDFMPDCHWPLSDQDDADRGDGGHVRLQPKFAVERFRDIARRLLASRLAALKSVEA